MCQVKRDTLGIRNENKNFYERIIRNIRKQMKLFGKLCA
jgi:hypothetical protein